MSSSRAIALVFATVSACGPASTPKRPADAPRVLTYAMVTGDRHTGEGEIRIDADGARHSHFTFNDRGRGPDLRADMTFDDRGALRTLHVTGHGYLKEPVDEVLEVKDGGLAWHSSAESGAATHSGFYVSLNEGLASSDARVQAMLHAPGRRIALLPAGEAWIEDDVGLDVELDGKPRHLRQIAIAGESFTPSLTWIDEDEHFFASVSSWSSLVRAGAEPLIPQLLAADQAWLAARNAKLATTLAHRPPTAGLAITHATVFDAERRALVPDRTVIIAGDRIAAVGDATLAIPKGAQIIDAHGRTLMPGLWDMHSHVFDGDGLLDLAFGITTVRDMGNAPDDLDARVKRLDAGTEVGPHVIRAGLIDGPGEFTVPTGVVAANADEARKQVQQYADRGYAQIKIYSSIDPALVPLMVEAAHARGLRVSGHVPFGMKAADAVVAGFDELQHANFLFLQFLTVAEEDTRTPIRFTRVAEGAASLDLDSKDVQAFLDLLVAHHTVLDPTLSVFEGMFVPEPDELTPSLAPYIGQLPAQVERYARGGGLEAPDGKRATFRASHGKMQELIARAWKRGIPIVAGTDGLAGLNLSRELELYVAAGIPAAEVLALATLGAARVMHVDAETGSIAAGKRADMFLLEGDPTRDIALVRNPDVVICRGVVFDPAELRAAVGMRPRAR